MYHFKTNFHKTLSDTHTPVALYLKLRDKFSGSFLLESSDYKSKENSYSYICLNPIASFVVDNTTIKTTMPNGDVANSNTAETDVAKALNQFVKQFKCEHQNLGFVENGLFGYTSYNAIPLFNPIEFKNVSDTIPLMQYHFFKYIIVFNHFNNELYVLEHRLGDEKSKIEDLLDIISSRSVSQFNFSIVDEEQSNFTDNEFIKIIKKGIHHCMIGDVFQVVVSRKFSQKFKGDDFNVYRALRSVNPSPYLFYFDYGSFRLLGSSPEAQLTIQNNKATIHPIAGTFKRTGNAIQDEQLATALKNDPKENAEHVMLVDLARNDLSKQSKQVAVESYMQVEYYSHVIHLVSKVSAELAEDYNPIEVLTATYPAGTLSGAPKHRAMQIIDENEKGARGMYGGAIGIIGLDGTFNHAIFIRSFVSMNNELTYQAGCGVVAKSIPENELQEVYNKLAALKKAISIACTI